MDEGPQEERNGVLALNRHARDLRQRVRHQIRSCRDDPQDDTRTPPEYAESRSRARYPSRIVATDDPSQIVSLTRELDADLVGIDEAEFFTPDIVDAVETLRRSGRHVVVTGLNLDFAGRPFGSMPELMARADEVTMLTAICVICGETATRTQRLVNGRPAAIDDPLVVIGGIDDAAVETYEARCNSHHEIAPSRAVPAAEAPSVPMEL